MGTSESSKTRSIPSSWRTVRGLPGLILRFRFSAQKRHGEEKDQLSFPEDIHNYLVDRNEEALPAPPSPPGFFQNR